MKILGIDPGYAILGYGIIEKVGSKFKVCDYGTITTDVETPMTKRLEYIYDLLRKIIKEHRPSMASIEELFFNANVKTAILVGQVRGIAILACVKGGLKVEEYTPLQIKQAIVGYGRAEKKQVQMMIKAVLNLDEIPKPDDAADALAAAVCHGHSADTRKILKEIRRK